MLTLDEAINHCEEVADFLEYEVSRYDMNDPYESYMAGKNGECAKEHRQLAKWLRELKYYKDRQDLVNKSWQELINYKEGVEKIKMRSQAYRELGEKLLAIGMEQALDILEEVKADDRVSN